MKNLTPGFLELAKVTNINFVPRQSDGEHASGRRDDTDHDSGRRDSARRDADRRYYHDRRSGERREFGGRNFEPSRHREQTHHQQGYQQPPHQQMHQPPPPPPPHQPPPPPHQPPPHQLPLPPPSANVGGPTQQQYSQSRHQSPGQPQHEQPQQHQEQPQQQQQQQALREEQQQQQQQQKQVPTAKRTLPSVATFSAPCDEETSTRTALSSKDYGDRDNDQRRGSKSNRGSSASNSRAPVLVQRISEDSHDGRKGKRSSDSKERRQGQGSQKDTANQRKNAGSNRHTTSADVVREDNEHEEHERRQAIGYASERERFRDHARPRVSATQQLSSSTCTSDSRENRSGNGTLKDKSSRQRSSSVATLEKNTDEREQGQGKKCQDSRHSDDRSQSRTRNSTERCRDSGGMPIVDGKKKVSRKFSKSTDDCSGAKKSEGTRKSSRGKLQEHKEDERDVWTSGDERVVVSGRRKRRVRGDKVRERRESRSESSDGEIIDEDQKLLRARKHNYESESSVRDEDSGSDLPIPNSKRRRVKDRICRDKSRYEDDPGSDDERTRISRSKDSANGVRRGRREYDAVDDQSDDDYGREYKAKKGRFSSRKLEISAYDGGSKTGRRKHRKSYHRRGNETCSSSGESDEAMFSNSRRTRVHQEIEGKYDPGQYSSGEESAKGKKRRKRIKGVGDDVKVGSDRSSIEKKGCSISVATKERGHHQGIDDSYEEYDKCDGEDESDEDFGPQRTSKLDARRFRISARGPEAKRFKFSRKRRAMVKPKIQCPHCCMKFNIYASECDSASDYSEDRRQKKSKRYRDNHSESDNSSVHSSRRLYRRKHMEGGEQSGHSSSSSDCYERLGHRGKGSSAKSEERRLEKRRALKREYMENLAVVNAYNAKLAERNAAGTEKDSK